MKYFFQQHKKKIIIGSSILAVAIVGLIIGLSVSGSGTLVEKPDLSKIPDNLGSFSDDALANDYSVPLSQDFPYGTKKIRGVNLGGWLILDPLVTPNIYTSNGVQDEWSLCEKLGKAKCSKLLNNHYDTFVTKDDIKKLREAGINHVRIPIGYWMIEVFEGDPYVYGSWEYLLRSIQWCREYGIRVMIDFHGVVGSQNGHANSGHEGEAGLLNNETKDKNIRRKNFRQYMSVFRSVVKYFNDPKWRKVVTMINIVNDPNFAITGTEKSGLDHYKDSVSETVNDNGGATSKEIPMFVVHDVFGPTFHWDAYFNKNIFPHIAVDRRLPLANETNLMFKEKQEKLDLACTLWKNHVETLDPKQAPMVINGEFNLAMTDCAIGFHGVNRGNRYEGTYKDIRGKEPIERNPRKCETLTSSLTDDQKTILTEFFQLQVQAYEKGAGWFFYNLKTQDNVNPEFDFLYGLENKYIQPDPTKHLVKCKA